MRRGFTEKKTVDEWKLQNEISKSEKTDSQDFDFFDLSRNLGIPSFSHFSATRSVLPRGWLFESWVRKLDMSMYMST